MNHLHEQKTNAHEVTSSKITLKNRIAYEIFSVHYNKTNDLPKASNQISQQVANYLASITNLNQYHITITSTTNSGVLDGETTYYVYETTVFLVHK